MEVLPVLLQAGMTEKEARIYVALLAFQEATPAVISRRSGVKRPTTYVILQKLEQEGMVGHFKRKKVLHYRALHPKLLLERTRRRAGELQRALPDLLALHSKYGTIPQMSVYEGEEGLIEIMEDTLTAKTELLCWADIALAVGSLKAYYPEYIRKKVARRLWVRGVFCYDRTALTFKKRGREELREIYLIPKEKYPFQNEINIYDDKIAIISHVDRVGVIIQNQAMAETQRSIFRLGFEYAKGIEEKILTAEDRRFLGRS
jgi:sugar-specific transcriptional regulator TrmB